MEKVLFGQALGVEKPIYVDEVKFDKGNGELHIYLDFNRGEHFKCVVCGGDDTGVHDTVEKCWRHLNFFQYKCYLHFHVPRIKCPDCGIHMYQAPWSRPGSGFTLLFEMLIMTLAKEQAVLPIAEMIGEHDTRVWRVIKHYVNKLRMEASFSNISRLGVDETSSRRGHKYVTVFSDLDERKVVFATEGKDAATVERFKQEMSVHNGAPEQIKEVAMDMSPAFISGVSANFPDAEITFDKFHVIKLLNEALDEVRRQEQKQNPALKGTRYIWLKNPENLKARQLQALSLLRKRNSKTARAYQMKRTFQDIFESIKEPEMAETAIRKWLSWAVRSRLEPIKSFAKTVKNHFNGIMRYFHSRLTSGIVEGINSRIQEAKRRAKGFRNIDNFITVIYLVVGKLPLKDIATHSI